MILLEEGAPLLQKVETSDGGNHYSQLLVKSRGDNAVLCHISTYAGNLSRDDAHVRSQVDPKQFHLRSEARASPPYDTLAFKLS